MQQVATITTHCQPPGSRPPVASFWTEQLFEIMMISESERVVEAGQSVRCSTGARQVLTESNGGGGLVSSD